MKVYLVIYSKLREYLTPKPAIGEKLEVEVVEGQTLRDLLSRYLPNLDEIGILMVDGNHQKLDYKIMKEWIKITVFPASGGG